VARLNRELRAALASGDVQARIAADGGDVLGSTPEECAADIDHEERKWGALVHKLGLKVEEGGPTCQSLPSGLRGTAGAAVRSQVRDPGARRDA
jgi:hypothetical protein